MLLSCKFSFTSFVLRAVLLVNGTLGTVERKNCMCSWWFQAPDYNKTCWNIHPSKQASIQCAQKKRVSHFQPIYIQSHSAATPRLKKKHRNILGSLFFSDFQERRLPNLCQARNVCCANICAWNFDFEIKLCPNAWAPYSHWYDLEETGFLWSWLGCKKYQNHEIVGAFWSLKYLLNRPKLG